ncbi:MAG: hypothetical protein MZW92_58770 [Comamonadaceae bacterium]|nr:hypothetical protein [Comamonadaceae bacterium]
MTAQARLSRLLRLAGVDFHVLTTLMARGWSVLAGALTVLLIPQFLSATQQGVLLHLRQSHRPADPLRTRPGTGHPATGEP